MGADGGGHASAHLRLFLLLAKAIHIARPLSCFNGGSTRSPCTSCSFIGNYEYPSDAYAFSPYATFCQAESATKSCTFTEYPKVICNCSYQDLCNSLDDDWKAYIKYEYMASKGLLPTPTPKGEVAERRLLPWMIAVMVVGSLLVVLGITAFLVWWCCCREKKAERSRPRVSAEEKREDEAPAAQQTMIVRQMSATALNCANPLEEEQIVAFIDQLPPVRDLLFDYRRVACVHGRKPASVPIFNYCGKQHNILMCAAPREANSPYFFNEAVNARAKCIIMAMDSNDLKHELYYPTDKNKTLTYVYGSRTITVTATERMFIGPMAEKMSLCVEVESQPPWRMYHYLLQDSWKMAGTFTQDEAFEHLATALSDALREAGELGIIVHCLEGAGVMGAVAVALEIVRRVLTTSEKVNPVDVAVEVATIRSTAVGTPNDFIVAVIVAMRVLVNTMKTVPPALLSHITFFEVESKHLAENEKRLAEEVTRRLQESGSTTDGDTGESGVLRKKDRSRRTKKRRSKKSRSKRSRERSKTKTTTTTTTTKTKPTAKSGIQPTSRAPDPTQRSDQ